MKEQVEKENIFNSYVIKGIVDDNDFSIKEILNLKEVKTYFFSKDLHLEVEKIIKDKRIDIFLTDMIKDVKNSEYLTIMTFENEKEKRFAVTVYDSDELWQDPVVMKIYSLD